jgi:hypothetical protein
VLVFGPEAGRCLWVDRKSKQAVCAFECSAGGDIFLL